MSHSRRWLVPIAFSLTAQTALSASSPDTLDYCDLVKDAARYSGTTVTVRAVYKFTQDGFVLFENHCKNARPALLFVAPETSQNPAVAASYRKLTQANPYAEVRAVVRGRFRQANQFECIAVYGGCYSYEMKDVILLSVSAD